jgi:hypothetical protein
MVRRQNWAVRMGATPRADLEPANWNSITELVTIGGQIVMDDLTPVAL